MVGRVIMDTSAFYALLSSSDSHHAEAREYYERLIDNEKELYTTSYILVEMAVLTQKRVGLEFYKKLLESIDGVVTVIWIDRNIHNRAWEEMNQKIGEHLSLVDWTTAVVASQLSAKVFCFDKSLAKIGLSVLPQSM